MLLVYFTIYIPRLSHWCLLFSVDTRAASTPHLRCQYSKPRWTAPTGVCLINTVAMTNHAQADRDQARSCPAHPSTSKNKTRPLPVKISLVTHSVVCQSISALCAFTPAQGVRDTMYHEKTFVTKVLLARWPYRAGTRLALNR